MGCFSEAWARSDAVHFGHQLSWADQCFQADESSCHIMGLIKKEKRKKECFDISDNIHLFFRKFLKKKKSRKEER
jgi:hypothetical protein